MLSFDAYDIRDYRPDDAAALFVVAAAIEALDAGQLVAWTEELEGRVESGARVWLLARGRRLAGYALVEPLPGLAKLTTPGLAFDIAISFASDAGSACALAAITTGTRPTCEIGVTSFARS